MQDAATFSGSLIRKFFSKLSLKKCYGTDSRDTEKRISRSALSSRKLPGTTVMNGMKTPWKKINVSLGIPFIFSN